MNSAYVTFCANLNMDVNYIYVIAELNHYIWYENTCFINATVSEGMS